MQEKRLLSCILNGSACLFFHPHGEACGAGGTLDNVLAGNARQSQCGAAMGTFAKDVSFTAFPTGGQPPCGKRKPEKEAAKRGVLPSSAGNVAGEQAEKSIAEEDKIKQGKREPHRIVLPEEAGKENTEK